MARAIGTYTFVPKITPPLTPLELRVTYEGIAPKDTPRLFPRDDLLPALGAARRAISEIDPEHPAQDLEVLNRQIELLITDITLRLTILDTEFSFQGLRQVYDDLGRLSEALNRIPDVNDDNGLQRHHTKMQTNIARWREGVLNVSKEFVYQRGENAEADKQVVPDSTINMRNGRSDNSEAWMTFYTSEQDARDYFLQQLSQSAGSHAEDSN
jgi:hypothetical protein